MLERALPIVERTYGANHVQGRGPLAGSVGFSFVFSFIFYLFQILRSSKFSKSCRNLIDLNQISNRNQSDFHSKSDWNLQEILQIDVHISPHFFGHSRWCFRFYAGPHDKEISITFEKDFEQKSDSFLFQI